MHAMKLVSPASLRTVASASLKATRLSLARSESTLFPTRLALARWAAGSDRPTMHTHPNAPLRAAWLTRAQHDFQAWLDAGGFVQHDDDALETSTLADACEPAATARLRIVR